MAHTLPISIAAAIEHYRNDSTGLSLHSIARAVSEAAKACPTLNDAEKNALRAELDAFNLSAENERTSDWGCHFGPMYTMQGKDGRTYQSPNIEDHTPESIWYWRIRASHDLHPTIKARYADAAWDLARPLNETPRVEDARTAVDAYLASTLPKYCLDLHDRLEVGVRALSIAIQIRDVDRTNAARSALMAFHREALTPDEGHRRGFWWAVPKRLLRNDRNGTTDDEAKELVDSLEDLCGQFANASKPQLFNPHSLKDAAELLVKFYHRTHRREEIIRLHTAVARAFEAAADLAEPMVRSSLLQTSINSFLAAGNRAEADRVRVEMQTAIVASRDSLKPFVTETTIPREDVDKFVNSVVVESAGNTLALIAKSFLTSRDGLEKELREAAKKAPLTYLMPIQLMQDNLISAVVGSLEEDLMGRMIHHTDFHFALNELWLMESLDRAIDKHSLTADHFTGWANRHNLFLDLTFVHEGFEAWFDGQYSTALHLLVPQVETAFRSIAAALGEPTTKKHPITANASVMVNLGDMLSNEVIGRTIGPDISLHFRGLYSDPRGLNLRNRVAHGTLRPSGVGPHILRNVVHSFLVLGFWKELAPRSTQ